MAMPNGEMARNCCRPIESKQDTQRQRIVKCRCKTGSSARLRLSAPARDGGRNRQRDHQEHGQRRLPKERIREESSPAEQTEVAVEKGRALPRIVPGVSEAIDVCFRETTTTS